MTGGTKFAVYSLIFLSLVAGVLWIMGGRPCLTSREQVIMATPECVFTWLVAPEKRTQWLEGLASCRILTRRDDGSPQAYDSSWRVGQRQIGVEERVQQYESGRYFSLSSSSGGVRTTRIYRLAPHSSGTNLTCQVVEDAAGELGRFRFALWKPVAGTSIDSELRRLKSLAERDNQPPTLFGELLKQPLLTSRPDAGAEKQGPE